MRRYVMLALVAALLAACATDKMRSRETVLQDTLKAYAGTIRWGDVAQAQAFIDPKVLTEHPPTALELARFKQVRITAYDEQPVVPVNENEVRQTVEIGLVNVNSQAARSVIDHQVWHYDEAQKRWWLTTGLPDITRQQ
jgi:type IV pilus biogenesis protein CpaD/CtpE